MRIISNLTENSYGKSIKVLEDQLKSPYTDLDTVLIVKVNVKHIEIIRALLEFGFSSSNPMRRNVKTEDYIQVWWLPLEKFWKTRKHS